MRKEEMMKVVFYISSLSRGGAERVVTTLARQMKNQFDVTVITDTVSGNEYDAVDFERINMGYVVYPDILRRVVHKVFYLIRLKRKIKKINPDVVISFSIDSALRMKKAMGKTSIKQILSVRSNPSVDYKCKEEIEKVVVQIKDFDGFVFQTEQQRDFFGKEIAEKSVIILNPMAEEFLNEIASGEKRREVATFGRLTKSKDHVTLLHAYDLAAEKLPDYIFSIYGEGELREEMEKIHRTLTYSERIVLQGECSNVKERMRQTEVFVLSSANEGLPNALMEAMAMSLPVISTACPCGGPETVIEQGINGLLVPVGDKKAIADAIVDLCTNREKARKLGEEATKLKLRCNPQIIAEQWKNYIQKIMSK